ncbi:MAG: benzoylformate decarboxylase [Thermomicrobiales bacterium]
MPTVRDVTYNLLRELGMTTVFGNPGSTEEPFLANFPGDFTYVLGLHEAVSVAMADGFAQASGNAAFVNLHTASGMGNGMGSLVTAWHSRAPLVVTAGQQTRQMLALEPWLVNLQATELPRPYVKWSHEPARAEDVPGAIERAYHVAMTPPLGPTFVSIPMDDWKVETSGRPARQVHRQPQADPLALAEAAERLRSARNPLLIVGAGVDRAGAWDEAKALAERLQAPVWEAPAPERASFPQDHPLFQGALPLALKPVAERLAGHDVVLLAGAAAFRYYPHIPGPVLPEGTELIHITDDPADAARAPVGTALIGEVKSALKALADAVTAAERVPPAPRASRAHHAATKPIQPGYVFQCLNEAMPRDVLFTEESASTRAAFYDQVRIDRPASYFATASGGLGFAMPAAVGVALARPGQTVCCPIGDGAALFGIQALWTAAQHRLPVVYLVLNNGGYGILKSFAAFQRTPGIPGLDLPGLDLVQIAHGFGARASRITEPQAILPELRGAFALAAAERTPVLLDIATDREVKHLFGPPVEE